MVDKNTSPKNDNNSDLPWLKKYPVDVNWHAQIPVRTMPEVFDSSVKKYGKKTFLSFLGKKYSYKQVGEMVDKMAKSLQDQGIKKGSKVGICLPNSPFFVISYYAALKTGATVVNYNPLYPQSQIEQLVKNTDTEIMICLDLDNLAHDEKMYDKIAPLLETTKLKKIIACDMSDGLPLIKKCLYRLSRALGNNIQTRKAKIKNDGKTLSFKQMLKSKGKVETPTIDPTEDVAVLQFTGGTTGTPKAAMLTHQNLTVNTQQTREWFSTMEDGKEKLLAVLPFFHVFAMTGEMNLSLLTGAELMMLPRFEINETLKVISKQKPTIFAGVPTLYQAINSHPKISKYDLSSLKMCIAGGAALPEQTKTDFEKISGCTLFEGYGLSETSPVATASPLKKAFQKANSIGLPLPLTKISIRDPETPDVDAGLNAKGEICIKGPQVMKGYLNNKEETDDCMTTDGYFRTGDIGYMDDDGYVFIVDRIKDMIIAGGYNIYPRKVEDAIAKHENVAEVVVAGVQDPYRGETVKAWVVMKPGTELSPADLKEFLKGKLSKIEMPKRMEFRDELPKTLIGKPDKKALIAEEVIKDAEEAKNKVVANDTAPKAVKKNAPKPN